MISLGPNDVNKVDCKEMKSTEGIDDFFDTLPLRAWKSFSGPIELDTSLFKDQVLGNWDLSSLLVRNIESKAVASWSKGVITPDNEESASRWFVKLPDRDDNLLEDGLCNFSISFDDLKWTEIDMQPKASHSKIVCDDETVEALFKEDINF